jgi:poly(3-hydroxybutyrate) depolymerase
MVTLAEENDFIVLFPDSLTLPDCPLAGKHWDVCENPPNVDTSQDIVFTRQLIEETSALYNVCETNVYTHGHSFGGFFSFYVAMTLPDQVAAFAAHSGGMSFFAPGFCWPRCVPAAIRKVPGFLLHSTDDSVVSYDSSVALDAELLAAGHESYFVTLMGLDHAFDQSYNQTTWDWFMARPLP